MQKHTLSAPTHDEVRRRRPRERRLVSSKNEEGYEVDVPPVPEARRVARVAEERRKHRVWRRRVGGGLRALGEGT